MSELPDQLVRLACGCIIDTADSYNAEIEGAICDKCGDFHKTPPEDGKCADAECDGDATPVQYYNCADCNRITLVEDAVEPTQEEKDEFYAERQDREEAAEADEPEQPEESDQPAEQ